MQTATKLDRLQKEKIFMKNLRRVVEKALLRPTIGLRELVMRVSIFLIMEKSIRLRPTIGLRGPMIEKGRAELMVDKYLPTLWKLAR